MKQKRPVIKRSRHIEDLHHLRLMSLLQEQVREREYKDAAVVLGIDRRTVAFNAKSGQLTNRVRERLERVLQYGVGSAAAEQQERNDKLEEHLDKMESQLKGLKENLRSGLKRLKVSLDGVRKYYGVQRRLVLEASRGVWRLKHTQMMRGRALESSKLVASAVYPMQLTGPTPSDSPDVGEQPSTLLERDVAYAARGAGMADGPAMPRTPGCTWRSKWKLVRSETEEGTRAELD